MCHRHAWLYLIGASGLLGCGSGAPGTEESWAESPPASPLSFDPPEPDPNASVPRALVVRIAGLRDPYRVRVQAYIDNVNRVPQTGCQEADLWRVGPRAVEWPASSTLVLPLDYASSLPDGVYAE